MPRHLLMPGSHDDTAFAPKNQAFSLGLASGLKIPAASGPLGLSPRLKLEASSLKRKQQVHSRILAAQKFSC